MALIEGATADADQIVEAARAWRDGESLARIAELAPFVEPTQTVTAEDAVSLAIQHLPANLDPTTYGAVEGRIPRR